MIFLVAWLGFCAFAATAATAPLWLDRLIATFLRLFNIRIFPLAVGIAILLTERPEQWSVDGSGRYMCHPDIGSIYIDNGAAGVSVSTGLGLWKPNWIERRIIRDAVDWRINGYVKNRIEVAMRRGALK